MDPPIQWNDDLFWLRDDTRSSPAVLNLLRDENSYAQARTAHLEQSRNDLYEEILSRIEEDADEHPSPRTDGFEYFSRTVLGQPFRIYLRRRYLHDISVSDAEEIVLDVNALAATLPSSQQTQCAVSEVQPSPTGRWLAYTLDTSGYETYSIHVRDLRSDDSGNHQDGESLAGTGGGIAWRDDAAFFYIRLDAAHRPFQVWRHTVGTPPSADALVYEEQDARFVVRCARARDGSLLFIVCESKETTEVRYVPCTGPPDAAAAVGSPPTDQPVLVRAREPGVRYEVDSHAPSCALLIMSNAGAAVNRQLLIASLDAPSDWKPLLSSDGRRVFGPSETRSLEAAFAFDRFLAVNGREDGFTQVWTVPLVAAHQDDSASSPGGGGGRLRAAGSCRRLAFPEEACTAEVWAVDNELFEPGGRLRVEYESMTSPRALLEFDVTESSAGGGSGGGAAAVSEAVTLHVQPVPRYDPSLYSTCRLEVPARDGETVPLTLLWRRRPETDASAVGGGQDEDCDAVEKTSLPFNSSVHLYAYGAYGASIDPHFSSGRLSLIDRGIVYAIAHVRGGGEKGQHAWYESTGKYLSKRNTFEDFVDCAEHLVSQGVARPGAITIEGRSAGGLLVGAVVNMAPRLFRAALAAVPFVDTMVSMCDPSIPLTTEEWEEWGARYLWSPNAVEREATFGWSRARVQLPRRTTDADAPRVLRSPAGNPNEAAFYDYMLSYSPMHNVQPAATYPAMLIIAGLNDPRVAYWEPTKVTDDMQTHMQTPCDTPAHAGAPPVGGGMAPSTRARVAWALTHRHSTLARATVVVQWAQVLRATVANGEDVLLQMDLTAGHYSAADRYVRLRQLAFEYAWLIDQHSSAE